MKTFLVASAAFSLCIFSPRCSAGGGFCYLSLNNEAAKAKQTAQDLKSALDQNTLAIAAWRSFDESFQAAHPGLPGLRFSSDFRVAFAKKNRSGAFPFEVEAAAVELSAEERNRAGSLHQEMLEAKRLLDQAQKNWSAYQNQLVLDYVLPTPQAGGAVVTLPSRQTATIPFQWVNGMVFTPDFRVAVPR